MNDITDGIRCRSENILCRIFQKDEDNRVDEVYDLWRREIEKKMICIS